MTEVEAELRAGSRTRAWAPVVCLVVILTAGTALRLGYFLNGDPFVDEWATMLVARSIWERGLPILPSGTFYGHGMLYSYLDALFLGLDTYVVHFAIAGWAQVPFCNGLTMMYKQYVFGLFINNSTNDVAARATFEDTRAELLREQIRAGLASCANFHQIFLPLVMR